MQQESLLDQALENRVYRALGRIGSNAVAQETGKKRYPRLEAAFRRLTQIIQHGITPRSEAEKIVEDARKARYNVEYNQHEDEYNLFDNLLNENDMGDRLEEILDCRKLGNEDLLAAIDLVTQSMPSWFKRLPGFFPQRRIVAYLLEACQLIPACENFGFMYIVSF